MQKFHNHHGKNITLLEDQTVAFRQMSFAHGITFSAKPLHPREIFLIEIDKNERGWSGHLRIGLTQLDPNDDFELPFYALPDLVHINQQKKSWIFAVTTMHCRFNNLSRIDYPLSSHISYDKDSILGDGEYIQTYQGSISRHVLRAIPHQKSPSTNQDRSSEDVDDLFEPFQEEIEALNEPYNVPIANDNAQVSNNNIILPTDVGSRIGIMYEVKGDLAEMHFILNGEDLGAWAKDISYKQFPLYAVIDVYGTTKQVKVIQICCVSSLQNACRKTILKCLNVEDVEYLPIPNTIKNYLKFGVM